MSVVGIPVNLIGQVLRAVSPAPAQPDQELELTFTDCRLRLNNPFTVRCDSNMPVSADSLKGCRVSSQGQSEHEWWLLFEGRLILAVSLREEDGIGKPPVEYRDVNP